MITKEQVRSAIKIVFENSHFDIYDFSDKIEVVFANNETVTLNELLDLSDALGTDKINFKYPAIEILKG